jgi:hypothetical protein
MNASPEAPVFPHAAPLPTAAAPATEYERFLAALPDPLREECEAKLTGSGLAANHPVFQVLADFFEKTTATPTATPKEPARDFIQEATLHADRATQLLNDFQKVPQAILARLEPQLLGLLIALNNPLERLENTSIHLQRNVEALPVLLLGSRALPCPPFKKWRNRFKWWLRQFPQKARWALADHTAWIVSGITSAAVAFAATVVILTLSASHLARSYEEAYQARLDHMEADSAADTVALNRLLVAGITLKLERSKDNTAYFLILQGAHKAAQPIDSPEGLALEVWP